MCLGINGKRKLELDPMRTRNAILRSLESDLRNMNSRGGGTNGPARHWNSLGTGSGNPAGPEAYPNPKI